MTTNKRSTKGSALTYDELDANFTQVDTNTSNIATNTANIATNTAKLAGMNSTGTQTSQFRSGQIIEVVSSLCNGSTVNAFSGNYTFQNVTAVQNLTDSHVDVTGSEITYTPPTGTKKVIYEFYFHFSAPSSDNLGHFKLQIDDTDVNNSRFSAGNASSDYGRQILFRWIIDCNASSSVADQGSFTSWTTSKTLNMQARRFSSGFTTKLHETRDWDGTNNDVFHQPSLTITAIA